MNYILCSSTIGWNYRRCVRRRRLSLRMEVDRSEVKRWGAADGRLPSLAVWGRSCASFWSTSRQARPLHISVGVQLPRLDGTEHEPVVYIAQNPIHTFPGNFPVDGEVPKLPIIVANKSL